MSKSEHRKVSAYPDNNQYLAEKIGIFERFPDKPYTQIMEALNIARIYLLERCHPALYEDNESQHNRQHSENIMSAFHWRNTASHILEKASLNQIQDETAHEMLGMLNSEFEKQENGESFGNRALISLLKDMSYAEGAIQSNRPMTLEECMEEIEQ